VTIFFVLLIFEPYLIRKKFVQNERLTWQKNTGKLFEDDFKASVPENTYYVRLHDAAIGFDTKNSKQRFAPKSPYDAILCRAGQMYAIELKRINHNYFVSNKNEPYICITN